MPALVIDPSETALPPGIIPPRAGATPAEWMAYRDAARAAGVYRVAMAVARQSVENLPSAKPRWPPIPRHLFKMKRDAAAKLAAERSKENKIALQALRVDASGIIRRIIIECAREWKSTPAEIISRRRAVVSVEPRFMAIYLAHALTVLSLSHIGREFACRERTTIMYSIDRAKAMLDSDPELAARVEAIKAAVVGGGEA